MSDYLRSLNSYELALRRQQAQRDRDHEMARDCQVELDRRAAERRDKRQKIKIDVEAAE